MLLKTFLLPVATDLQDSEAQVVFCGAIPILSSLLLWIAQLSLGVTAVFSLARPMRAGRLSLPAQRNFILLLILSAFLLATVRRLSFWGTWGETSTFSIAPLWGLPELAIMAACLAAFVWGAFARTASLPVAFRFQPAIVVVVTGLFIAAMAQPAQNVLVSTAVAIIIHVDEACAYLLFWDRRRALARHARHTPVPRARHRRPYLRGKLPYLGGRRKSYRRHGGAL